MRYRKLHNTISCYSSRFFTDYQCYITTITRYLQALKTRLFCLNVSTIQLQDYIFPFIGIPITQIIRLLLPCYHGIGTTYYIGYRFYENNNHLSHITTSCVSLRLWFIQPYISKHYFLITTIFMVLKSNNTYSICF